MSEQQAGDALVKKLKKSKKPKENEDEKAVSPLTISIVLD